MTSPQKTWAGYNWSNMTASAVPYERNRPMKRSKFSEEQIVYVIRQADAGTPVGVKSCLVTGPTSLSNEAIGPGSRAVYTHRKGDTMSSFRILGAGPAS